MKKIVSLIVLCVMGTGILQAQEIADSMRIYYRRGYRNVDLTYRDNRSQLEHFITSVTDALHGDKIDKIVIHSYASPDGSSGANEKLAERRAEELKKYLVSESNIPADLIVYQSKGIAWDALRQAVSASEVSWKDDVLYILDNTPEWIYDENGKIVDGRKKQLMDLQGGRPYNDMMESFFPELRNSSNTMLYLRAIAKTESNDTQGAETETETETETYVATVQTEEVTAEGITESEVKTAPASSVAATGTAPAVNRQIREYPKNIIGMHAGYSSSWITSYGMSSSTIPGFEVGVTDRILLSSQTPFYLRTGLSFISKGYEINGYDDSRTTLYYLQIPVEVDYTISIGRLFALIPNAGLYYSIGLGGKRIMNDESVAIFSKDGGFSRHDMGWVCGIDASIGRFCIGAAYQSGLINIDKNDMVYGDDTHMIGYKKVRNHSFVVKLGVNF